MNFIFTLIQNLLPATCLALFCVVSALDRKNPAYKILLTLLGVLTVCFSIDSAIQLGAAEAYFEIMSISTGALIAPLTWLYIRMSQAKGEEVPYNMVFKVIAPFALFVGVILLFFLTPIAGQYLQSPTSAGKIISLIISCFFVVESVIIVYYLITNLGKTEESRKVVSIVFAVMFLFLTIRVFVHIEVVGVFLNLILIGLILMVITTILKLDYTAAIPAEPVKTTASDTKPEVENSVSGVTEEVSAEESEDETDETEEADADVDSDSETETEESSEPEETEGPSRIVIPPLSEAAEDSLRAKFENFLINQEAFLRPGLTMGDVAKELKTNRTYVSQLVNKTYSMTFPEFLNSLRIDYAEQYILHNRGASQQEVARACGFPSASSFNVTFKKITGVTPRIWLATNKDKQ